MVVVLEAVQSSDARRPRRLRGGVPRLETRRARSGACAVLGVWCLCWRRKCSLACPGGVSDCVPVRPFGRSISDTAPFGAPTGSLLNGGAPAADAGGSAAASEPAGGYQRRSVDASLFDDGLDLDRRLKLVEGKLNQAAREASL